MTPDVDVIMPVHNEAASIASTLEEWHAELHLLVNFRFILAEDGSKDNTREILYRLIARFPIVLDFSDKRRGYAAAMIAGMNQSVAPYVLAVDADGQFDPKDFRNFWRKREECPFLIGWRQIRADVLSRKIMSGSFKLLHRALFRMNLHDASCGYVLLQRNTMAKLLPGLGLLPEGFWLEVTGKASRIGVPVAEVPIHHRSRTAGKSVVYRPGRVPGIAWRNISGLFKLWLKA